MPLLNRPAVLVRNLECPPGQQKEYPEIKTLDLEDSSLETHKFI